MLANGFIIVGVEPYWQGFAIGAVLIVAVSVDQARRGRLAAGAPITARRRGWRGRTTRNT